MMCYKHPNGRHSVLSYPTIFCGEEGYGLLLAFGIALLTLFVLGFLVVCSYAVWNLPRWSVEGKHAKVQSFRFCTSNFRFDKYGFIVPLLCRGLGFAMSIVVGTNLPPVQTGLVSIVLVTYTVLQASLRPWKAPAINVADTVLSASLLILASRSIQVDVQMEADFAEYFTVVVLMLVLACLASLVALCIVGVVAKLVGGNYNRILSLGSHDATKISETLKQCAQALLEIEHAYLGEKIGTMNSYDVRTIVNFINVVGADLQDDREMRLVLNTSLSRLSKRSSILGGRVTLSALNANLNQNSHGTQRTAGNDDPPALPEAQDPEPAKAPDEAIVSKDPTNPTAELHDVDDLDPGEEEKILHGFI
eukprot:s2350_g10.t1